MAIKLPIYMDYHATTPVDPRVVDTMLPYFHDKFGNAASRNHWLGPEEAVENARSQIARLINATPKEIIFTSGATESNNLALKGAAEMYREKGNHIITQVIEHKAVLDTCKRLEKYGLRSHLFACCQGGRPHRPRRFATRAITPKTILISIMYANNEIGVVQPIKEIGKIAKEKGILFIATAFRHWAKFRSCAGDKIDVLSLTAHKLYGPKGSGALYVRRNPRVQITAQIDGGGHQRGMRSGTLNVPGIVGFGKAAELCQNEMARKRPSARAARPLEGQPVW